MQNNLHTYRPTDALYYASPKLLDIIANNNIELTSRIYSGESGYENAKQEKMNFYNELIAILTSKDEEFSQYYQKELLGCFVNVDFQCMFMLEATSGEKIGINKDRIRELVKRHDNMYSLFKNKEFMAVLALSQYLAILAVSSELYRHLKEMKVKRKKRAEKKILLESIQDYFKEKSEEILSMSKLIVEPKESAFDFLFKKIIAELLSGDITDAVRLLKKVVPTLYVGKDYNPFAVASSYALSVINPNDRKSFALLRLFKRKAR